MNVSFNKFNLSYKSPLKTRKSPTDTILWAILALVY